MPHLPVFFWIVLAIIPVVIGLLLLVEATVVRPSIVAERRAQAPEPGPSGRSSAHVRRLNAPAG